MASWQGLCYIVWGVYYSKPGDDCIDGHLLFVGGRPVAGVLGTCTMTHRFPAWVFQKFRMTRYSLCFQSASGKPSCLAVFVACMVGFPEVMDRAYVVPCITQLSSDQRPSWFVGVKAIENHHVLLVVHLKMGHVDPFSIANIAMFRYQRVLGGCTTVVHWWLWSADQELCWLNSKVT